MGEINFITAFIKILHSHLVDIILVIMVWDMHNQKMNIDKNQVNIILLKKVLYKVVLVQVNLLLNPQVLQNKLNQLKVVIINLDQVQVFQKINQVQIIIKMVIWVLHLCLHHHLDPPMGGAYPPQQPQQPTQSSQSSGSQNR